MFQLMDKCLVLEGHSPPEGMSRTTIMAALYLDIDNVNTWDLTKTSKSFY